MLYDLVYAFCANSGSVVHSFLSSTRCHLGNGTFYAQDSPNIGAGVYFWFQFSEPCFVFQLKNLKRLCGAGP